MLLAKNVTIDGLLPEIEHIIPAIDQAYSMHGVEATLLQSTGIKPCTHPYHSMGLAIDVSRPEKRDGVLYAFLRDVLPHTYTITLFEDYFHIAFIGTVNSALKSIDDNTKLTS